MPQLMKLHEGSFDYEQSSWDTFVGWKEKERRVIKGEKGSPVRMLIPLFYRNSIVYKENCKGKKVPIITECDHFLFHHSQTIEGSKVL